MTPDERESRFRQLVGNLSNMKRGELWEIFHDMEQEIKSLRAFKQNVDDALNSYGSYKP